jgi:hypothetical protein
MSSSSQTARTREQRVRIQMSPSNEFLETGAPVCSLVDHPDVKFVKDHSCARALTQCTAEPAPQLVAHAHPPLHLGLRHGLVVRPHRMGRADKAVPEVSTHVGGRASKGRGAETQT